MKTTEMTEQEKQNIIRHVRRWRKEHQKPQTGIRVAVFDKEDGRIETKPEPVAINRIQLP